jgi:glycosyltransferase involved in cell wall biosynthesis
MNNSNGYHVSHLIGNAGLYGAERWILAFFSAANGNGIRFSLVNFTEDRQNHSNIVRAAQKLNVPAFDFFTGGSFNPMSGIRFGLWAKKNNVNILHSHGFKADTIAVIASLICKSKLITTPHGWSLEKDLKLRIYENFDRFLFRFMDSILPLSPQLYSDIVSKRQLANKTKLILNAIDIIEIDSIDKPRRRDNSIFLMGYIGQLIERKNLSLLLKAIKLLSIKRKRFRLILVGDGHLRSSLEEEVIRLGIDPYVEFYGFRKDALKLLKSLNLLILPSLMEGIPRCVMEAMAAMVPVAASDMPGNKELIIHGETGLLFDPYNQDELVQRIIYVMDNKDDTSLMVRKARKRIEDRHSNLRMFDEYTKVYDSLVYRT